MARPSIGAAVTPTIVSSSVIKYFSLKSFATGAGSFIEVVLNLEELRKNDMKIIDCRKGNLDIEYNGKLLRCWGDMTGNGFSIFVNAMEWITSEGKTSLSDEEKKEIIPEIKRYCKKAWKFKLEFRDEKGRKFRIKKFRF